MADFRQRFPRLDQSISDTRTGTCEEAPTRLEAGGGVSVQNSQPSDYSRLRRTVMVVPIAVIS
ncbi:MAG: hypothetical protein K0Q52_384 [Microbacterium sp.]|nr:hypothetical protein [Microbacterium sp.]